MTGELLTQRRLVLLLDRLCGELLERLRHHIHIASLEKDEIAWRLLGGVLLESIVNPVFLGGALKGLDIAVCHLDVADGGILLDQMLDGLLAPIGLRLRGSLLSLLDFLNELPESLFQHFGGDLAALDSDSNNLGIYFILHGNLLSGNWWGASGLRRHTPKIDNCHA